MKNKLNLIGIILLVMIIGLSAAGCGGNAFKGTWSGVYYGSPVVVAFTDNTFTMTMYGESETGTYTRNGNTAVLTVDGSSLTATVSGKTLTMEDMTLTKQ